MTVTQLVGDEQIEYAYSYFKKLDDGVWVIDGEWSNKLGRRMTILASSDGNLLIHNPIKLYPVEIEKLRTLGTVKWILAPNIYHTTDANWMKKRFSDANLYLPNRLVSTTNEAKSSWELMNEIPYADFRVFNIQGTSIDEVVIYHKKSKTLVLCDLAFNMQDVFHGMTKIIMKLNGVGGKFGPSKIFKLLFVKNRNKFIQSIKRLNQLEINRIIVNHGAILDQYADEEFKQAFERVFKCKL